MLLVALVNSVTENNKLLFKNCLKKTHLGGSPAKSSEIPPRWVGSLLIGTHIFIGVS